MDVLSKKIKRTLREKIAFHRNKFNEYTSYNPNITVRILEGHKAYESQLSNSIRVAHLTDQHVGRVTPMKVQRHAIELALKQNPDIFLLTGDFVCHSELYLNDLYELIKSINKPIFAVLGNHDHWTNAQSVKKTLIKAGAEVLENAHTTIKINNDYLQICGVDDAYTHHADVKKATDGLKKNIATIGLSHIAEQADLFWELGVPMVLSGHTHAGQITVAKIHEIILKKIIGHKYIHGFYGNSAEEQPYGLVYVSAGIGAAVMPIRIGEKGKREVAVFDLGPINKS